MKNIKFYLINFLFWLGGYSVFAQDITNPHTNIGHGKQSPNAKGYSAENVQVNQSTGAAGITLPITSLSSHTLTVPVSLVYQSTGIKVEDKASWVGLGWNLQAGGMITRRVNGRPDEFPSNPQGSDLNNGNYGDKLNGLPNGGYLANSTIIPNEYQSGNISHENIARRTLHGQLDLEPDEFYFNFLGMSGMFVFDENGIAQCIPYQNLKIEKIGLMDGFVIKDYSGYEYYFLAIEKTRTTNSCFNTAAYNSLGTISGWYISEIKNVNGQTEFIFNYEENEDQSTTLSYFEYAKSYVCDNPNSCPPSSQEICTITSKCNMLHLTSIESFHGELKFEKGAEREDLFNDYVLAKIRMFNSSNVNVFNVEFSYDYFLGSLNTKRLKLTSMREVNSLGESLAPTLLSYIDNNLPEHSFKGIDHWGYYNGRNTDTYLLTDPISRHPDPLYTGASMLKSITSPSGSILSFEFEPNSYGTDPNGLVEVTCEEIASADGLEFPQYYWNQAPNTDYFELTAPGRVSVSYNVVQDFSCSVSFVKITNASNEVVFFHNEQTEGLLSTILNLPEGNYTVSATKGSNCTNPSFNQSGAWITVSLIPYYAENLGTLIGGGMRIKSISSQESLSGEIAKRNFNYNLFNDMGRSSGYLLTIPYYSYYQQYGHVGWIANGCGMFGNGFCDNCNESVTEYEPITEYGVLKRFSSSVDPIQMANGGYVVYTNVTETMSCESDQNCDNGRIEFEYSIFKTLTVDPVIQNIPVNKFWRTGNLIKERSYNSSGSLVGEISYFYNASPGVQIKGLKAGDRQFNLYQTSNPSNAPCMVRWVVDAVVYKYENEKFFLERKIEKKFDQVNPSKFTTTEHNYTYNSALQLILTETVLLESQEYTKQMIRYPSNYLSCQSCSSGQAAALKFMKHEDNRYWSVPIEVLNLKKLNGEYYVVSGEIQEYEVFSNKLILIGKSTLHINEPIAESNFQLSSIVGEQFTKHPSYFIQEKVQKVNSNLNTISLQRTYGLSQTLLRDYPDDKVVATVVNAEIEQCAFTSFETSTGNGWNYSPSSCIMQSITHLEFQLPKSYTGNKYFAFNNNNISSQSMMAGRYKLSFWTISSIPLNITISNNANLLNSSVNISNNHPYWKYNEYEINSASEFIVTISGLNGSLIDELRLVPYESQIKTECFNTDGTVISTCDENSVVRLFTYDSWKRVEWILDQKLQVISKSEYHFQDPSNPNDHSWSKTTVALEPNLTRTAILNAPLSSPSISSNISYQDGFGRVIQNIAIRQSPSKRDIVSFHKYDSFGREKIKYSPFTLGNGNNGGFIEDVQLKQLNFYNTSPRVAKTQFPFSEYIFESSPQSRVIEKGNVGETWQLGNGHTVRMSYELNGENEILNWVLLPNGCSALGEFGPSYMPVNSLFKNSIIDENGREFWEFRNHQGQLICKRTKVLMSGEGATSYSWYNGFGHHSDDNMAYLPGLAPTWRNLDTYYVYDSFGNLAFEIPPIAILAMNGNYQFFSDTNGVNYQIFDGYITANKYHKNGKLSESKKPGEVWAKFAYNRLGRLVAHQKPSSASETNKWHFNKYDALGRIIQSGLFESSLTRAQMQSMLDLQESELWESKTGSVSSPYTNVSFPTDWEIVLVENYYDDYKFNVSGFTTSGNSAIFSRSNNGKETGSKVLVLDNNLNEYQVSVQYYNSDGFATLLFRDLLLGGSEKIENSYDYLGRLTMSIKTINFNGQISVKNRFDYDHSGRLLATYQKIGNDEEVTISKLTYNELGQVVKKQLHLTASSNTGMQIVDYRYNERGWLFKINNADLVNDGDNLESWDVFGEELLYDNAESYLSNFMEVQTQFNGNVAAIKWKTNRTPDYGGDELAGHSYVFRYDELGQMTGAFYAASADTYIDNYSKRGNMWDETLKYDANGNVLNINRNRGINDQGAIQNSPLAMDRLSFSYKPNSNTLLAVNDFSQSQWITNEKYSHFINGSNTTNEYFYDDSGRLTKDLNKGIDEYEYNTLGLVSKVVSGSEAVDFVWNAAGVKLAKTIGTMTTYYFGEFEFLNTELQSIYTAEGVARCPNCMLSGGDWKYDYYLTDHLGNIRAVITEEDSELIRERVTVEIDRRTIEDANFENVTSTEKDKPYLYPYDPNDPYNMKVTELTSFNGKIIGPAKVIEVKEGEKIDLSTQFWYTEESGNPLNNITEILAGTLLNLSSSSLGIIESGPDAGLALLNNVNSDQFGVFSNFINNAFSNEDFSKPQAYLVYITFDKKMMIDPLNSGTIQVGNANELGLLEKIGIQPKKDGYFYTYVTNKSEGKVNFNNLQITRWAPRVRAIYDYYPFGLTWENPTTPGDPNAVHDRTMQGKELQFSELSGSKGLNLLDFHARMFDPCLARWNVPDPAYQFSNSYIAMGNNPVIGLDPDGRIVDEFFDAIEYISPISVRPVLYTGTDKRGWGWQVSIGIPKLFPFSYRWEYGETYYKKGYGDHSGREIKKGAEVTYFGVISFGGYEYSGGYANGEFSQTTATIVIGVPYLNVKYENDIMPWTEGPSVFQKMMTHGGLGLVPAPDRGDRYRTAGMKLQIGPLQFGFEFFTGDPGLKFEDRKTIYPYLDSPNGAYTVNEFGDDPNKYREGIVYWGVGPFRFGGNNEANRHTIQNEYAHDRINRPWFQVLETPNTRYFSFSTGPASGVY